MSPLPPASGTPEGFSLLLPLLILTSPAVVVAVLAVEAALGVGDRWRVTNAMSEKERGG